mgnify:CR=1 FL=1
MTIAQPGLMVIAIRLGEVITLIVCGLVVAIVKCSGGGVVGGFEG